MNAVELLDQLNALDVRLVLDNGTLRANAPSGALNETLVREIKMHKPELIAFLLHGECEQSKCVHFLPFDAIETPAPGRRGWLKSTCRKCDRFLGYREVTR